MVRVWCCQQSKAMPVMVDLSLSVIKGVGCLTVAVATWIVCTAQY